MPLLKDRPRLPGTVWALGFTSLFMDASSEIVHAILPLFLANALLASNALIGLIDGLAEAMALVVRILSGTLSDHWRRRKAISAFGYGVSAAAKLLFPLATSAGPVLCGRLLDRFGKGLRGAPRDALIADWVEPARRGYAYGVRQALDNAGAVLGPLAAILLLVWHDGDLAAVLWWALPPAWLAFAIMLIAVREPSLPRAIERQPFPLRASALRALPPGFWPLMALLFLLLLPRFTEAFLVLRAQQAGIAPVFAPLVLAIMSAVAVPLTPLAGLWSDRRGRHGPIGLGFLFLMLAQLCLAFGSAAPWVWAGAALWGLHVAFTQGIFSALIADLAPAQLRGTAFGIFSLVAGLAVLLGSAGMGALMDAIGAGYAFAIAAGLTAAALALFLYRTRRAGR